MDASKAKKTVLQMTLSDGSQAALRVEHPLTTATIREVVVYLLVYEWALQRREVQEKNQEFATTLASWWVALRGRRPEG